MTSAVLLPFLMLMFMLLAAAQAFAHPGHGPGPESASAFIGGLLHPLHGLDHVLAMVAVGLWGSLLGAPAIWLLPVAFPMVMAFGAALGVIGVPLPFVEAGIALSAVALGLLIACAARLPLWGAVLVVAAFAIFHGHAHGTELPAAADPFTWSLGFVLATGALHAAGIAIGLLVRWPSGRTLVRAGGGLIGLAGVALLFGFA